MLKKITIAVTAAALAFTAACGSSADDGPASDLSETLVVGATSAPHGEILNFVKSTLADKAGLKLEVKEFSDYVQPNLALNDGQLGANYFQHKPYLEDFSKEKGLKLAWVGNVHLEPLGVYSKKVKALTELPQGATVAVPSDASNEARAYKLLADNGVITLKDAASVTSTAKDITGNPKALKFKPIEAAQLPRSLSDVDAAVINGNFALQGGLVPAKDALALEKADGNPYANGVVVKAGNEGDARVKELVKLLQSAETQKFITDKYQGSVLPAA